MWRWLLALGMTAATLAPAQTVCDVRAYGAAGDGKTKDTAAIQKAIDACAKSGGVVRLTGGTFLTAPIVLKSHIALEVDKGATLLGSPDPDDYLPIDAVNKHTPHPLIYSQDAEDITIAGGGVIDGNGAPFWKRARANPGKVAGAHTRPRLIVLNRTRNIDMHDITVQNGASWQITPLESSNIDIHDIRVLAPSDSPNTDGIDPFSCHHVKISHVYISVGDDNIAVKSGMPGTKEYRAPSTDIIVTDSEFGTGHGMSIGSEGTGGMQGVYVSHLLMKGTENGIRIKSARDRGNKDMGRFYFNDIVMEGVKYPILVDHYYHSPSEIRFPENDSRKQQVGPLTPYYHDIVISNVKAVGAKIAAIIAALPEAPLTSIVLKNVDIGAETGMRVMNATVTLENVNIRPARGIPITVLTGGRLIGK